MTTGVKDAMKTAVDAALTVAEDVVQGRLTPAQLELAAVEGMRQLFGTVGGPDDPAAELQLDVARQILAAGRIPADEMSEWLAVARAREGVTSGGNGSSETSQADDEDADSDPRNDVPTNETGAAGGSGADSGSDEAHGPIVITEGEAPPDL